MTFKLSIVTWEAINRLNEKYHILCTEVNDDNELSEFFNKFETIASTPEDTLYVRYVFDLNQLCSDIYADKAEFAGKAFDLNKQYIVELDKLKTLKTEV